MKKLIIFCGMFFLIAGESKAQKNNDPVFYSYSSCIMQRSLPALGFSFYFRPSFIRPSLTPAIYRPLLMSENTSVFQNFQMMNFQFDKGAVFCRMENECTKRYGFMLSIHAGGYTER